MKSIVRIVFFFTISLNAQNWDWKKTGSSYAIDGYKYLETDSQENVYVSGWEKGGVTLSDEILVNSNVSEMVPFIAKYNSEGDIDWALSMNSDAFSTIIFSYGIPLLATDANDRLWFSGTYNNVSIVDEEELQPVGAENAYVSALDSSGNIVWHEYFGSTDGRMKITGLTHNDYGQTYISGWFDGNLTIGEHTAYRENRTTFIARLDVNRSVDWFHVFPNSLEGESFGGGLLIDQDQNLYISGVFKGKCAFGESNFSETTNNEADGQYIIKFTNNGALLWCKFISEVRTSLEAKPVRDTYNNIYICAGLPSSIDFEGDFYDNNLNGGSFILKMNSDGETIWFKQFGGEGSATVYESKMEIGWYNRLYMVGRFPSSTKLGNYEFDIEPGLYGNYQPFFAELNTSGEVILAKHLVQYTTTVPDGDSQDGFYFFDIHTDNRGDLHIAAMYTGNILIDGEDFKCEDNSWTEVFQGNVFIGKLSTGELSQTEEEKANAFLLASNVVDASAILYLEEPVRVRLLNINGQVLRSYTFTAGEHYIETSSYSSGMYILQYENSLGAH